MKVLIVADGKGKPSSKPLVGPGGFFLARGLLRQRREETIRDDQVVIEARGNWPREEFDYAHLGVELDAAWASHDVVVALGDTVFHTLTGSDLPTDKVRGYVFASDGKWIIPTYDPSELLKGHQYLLPVLLWDIDKARDILHGYTEEPIGCLADPPLEAWQKEVSKILRYIDTAPDPVVAFDIETPYKRGKNEGEVVDDADPTQTILDISFCIEATEGVTVPFVLPYLIGVKEIFQKLAATPRARAIAWNLGYDRPRVRRHLGNQILPRWGCEDTMIAHHVLFNSLDRGLGFATSLMPYNQRRFPAWKHLGQADPTYRVMDSVALWRNHQDIQKLLVASGQMAVYQQMVVKLDPILEVAEQTGLLIDEVMRTAVSASLGAQQQALEAKMSQVVPNSLLPQKVWKTRKAALKAVDAACLREVPAIAPAMVCPTCNLWPVTKAHVSKKFLTA